MLELQASAALLPDDYLVVLVGDMVTEEALPSYMNMLNTLDGLRDETGVCAASACMIRVKNRCHGDKGIPTRA